MANEKKILHLTLNKKWFDLIKDGIKNEEYREFKDYWHKRLKFSPLNTKPFDIIEFTNGYNKKSPKLIFEMKGISIGYGLPEWGANERQLYYVILLGNELERINC